MDAKMYLGNNPNWTLEELDRIAITLHKAIVQAGQKIYYGFLYQPGKGFYLIAPEEMINPTDKIKIETGFDFEEYIKTVPLDTLDKIWITNYKKLPPSLGRLYR